VSGLDDFIDAEMAEVETVTLHRRRNVALAVRRWCEAGSTQISGVRPQGKCLGGFSFDKSQTLECPLLACAVTRRRFPVGASPTRQPLQPEAIGAVMEETKWLKPSISVSRNTVTARVCRP
jgi:hypothetical protein